MKEKYTLNCKRMKTNQTVKTNSLLSMNFSKLTLQIEPDKRTYKIDNCCESIGENFGYEIWISKDAPPKINYSRSQNMRIFHAVLSGFITSYYNIINLANLNFKRVIYHTRNIFRGENYIELSLALRNQVSLVCIIQYNSAKITPNRP